MIGPRVHAPTDLATAIGILASDPDDAAPIAGGASWLLRWSRHEPVPSTLVSLAGIPPLAGIASTDDEAIVIGAMTRLATIERSALIADRSPGLVAAIRAVGSVRIRNQATIGGNLADALPAADPPPALIALDARLRLFGPDGPRVLDVASWCADGPAARRRGEVIVAVEIPPRAPGSGIGYWSLRAATAGADPHLAVASRMDVAADGTIADARLVVATADGPPRRAPEAEAALVGREGAAGVPQGIGSLAAGSVAGSPALDADRASLLEVAIRRAVTAALAEGHVPVAAHRARPSAG